MLLFFGLVLTVGLAHGDTSTTAKAQDPEALRYKVLRDLIVEGNRPLPKNKSCDSFIQSGQDTVGKFIAWNLSFYADKQANSIDATCDGKSEKKLCTISFYADSRGESPWACGLRFKYDTKKPKVDTSTMECIGTC